MLSKPSLSGLLSPIIVPIVFFLGTYFLFPDFAYNFYGTSFKHRNVPPRVESRREAPTNENTSVSNVPNDNQQTAISGNEESSYNIEKDVERLKNITEAVVNTASVGVETGIKTIKNVFEYPENGTSSKDVINRYKQKASQEIR